MSDKGSRSPSPRSRSRSASPRAARSRSPSPRPRSRSPEAHKEERPRGDAPAQGNNPGNNLYVANLSLRTTESELEELFAKFGRLEKCEVIMDPGTRMSRGFGFVTFEDVRDAQDAVAEMNGKEVAGRSIRVEHAKRTRGHERTPGRYLGPLQASSKYGNTRDRGSRDRSRDRGRRSRSRSRDRGGNSRRYDDRDRDRDRDRRYDDRGRGSSDRDRYDDRRRR